MIVGQTGIFALGDAAHGFFEFALAPGADPRRMAGALADLRLPHTTVGGVNLVVGYRPDLWRQLAPDDVPADLHDFAQPIVGPDGFRMPATQADLFVWFAAAAYDIVFDLGTATVGALRGTAGLVRELAGWSYRHSRDLTGFEDGTENPNLYEAPSIALVPDGPGAGGSVLLFQQWVHLERDWNALPQARQEQVIGRTKPDSVEFPEAAMPADSHVARTKVHRDGAELDIFRRNVPYGTVGEHGTVFVGFSCEQGRMQAMLEQMAGIGGPRDALTRYSTPLTGAYYFCPSIAALQRFATPADAG